MNTQSHDFAELKIDGKVIRLPIVVGTEGERALDITNLRQESGLVSLDPGFANTASCMSRITYVDGERGILRYRGIPIEELVNKAMFVDVAYLLVHGQLPDANERRIRRPEPDGSLPSACGRIRLSDACPLPPA